MGTRIIFPCSKRKNSETFKRQDSEFRYFENIRFKGEKLFYCAIAKNHSVAFRENEKLSKTQTLAHPTKNGPLPNILY